MLARPHEGFPSFLLMLKFLLFCAAALLLGLPPAAYSATIHSPAAGFTAAENEYVSFDWAWDSDEYASRIVFARVAAGEDPFWFGTFSREGIVAFGDRYGPYLSSNARIRPAGDLAPGEWYWRMCNYSIYGEDDKCGYDSVPPRLLTVVDVPDCQDGWDNDGDGRTDALDGACRANLGSESGDPMCDNDKDDDSDGRTDSVDPGCQNGRTDEASDPICNNGKDDDGDGSTDYPMDTDCRDYEGGSEAAPPLPALLSADEAKQSTRRALGRVFPGRAAPARNYRARCTRLARTKIRCSVSWSTRRDSFQGRVVITGPTNRRFDLIVRRRAARCRRGHRCVVIIRRGATI